jgi:PPOX class probable F420-dependent enzyme
MRKATIYFADPRLCHAEQYGAILHHSQRHTEGLTMPADQFKALQNEKYISLTTFRRDGRAVATPVWFALDGDRLVVYTDGTTGKVKRIRNNPEVTVAACTASGKVKGPAIPATATILPPGAGAQADRLLSQRYPVAKPIIGVFNRLSGLVRRRPAGQRVYLEIRPR